MSDSASRRGSDDTIIQMAGDVGEMKGKIDSLVERLGPLADKVDAHGDAIASAKGWIKGLGAVSVLSVGGHLAKWISGH